MIFFFAGALAQRNDWMTSIKDMSRVFVYTWAVAGIALFITVCMFLEDNTTGWQFRFFMGVVWKGFLCMGLSLAVTVFFMDCCNKKFKYLTPFFSKAMYTAYIIQYAFPIIAASKCVVLIFDANENIEYVDGSPYKANGKT